MIKINEFLAENKIKDEIEQLLLKYKHGNNIHENAKKSKTIEPHKFIFNFAQILDLKSSRKHVSFQDLPICYTSKNIRKQ